MRETQATDDPLIARLEYSPEALARWRRDDLRGGLKAIAFGLITLCAAAFVGQGWAILPALVGLIVLVVGGEVSRQAFRRERFEVALHQHSVRPTTNGVQTIIPAESVRSAALSGPTLALRGEQRQTLLALPLTQDPALASWFQHRGVPVLDARRDAYGGLARYGLSLLARLLAILILAGMARYLPQPIFRPVVGILVLVGLAVTVERVVRIAKALRERREAR